MPITGNEGEFITDQEFEEQKNAYATANPEKPTAQLLGNVKMEELISQPGAKAFRVYYTINQEGESKIAIVAVDEHGKDFGLKLNNSLTCPPYCN
jgi:hypothetical protein